MAMLQLRGSLPEVCSGDSFSSEKQSTGIPAATRRSNKQDQTNGNK